MTERKIAVDELTYTLDGKEEKSSSTSQSKDACLSILPNPNTNNSSNPTLSMSSSSALSSTLSSQTSLNQIYTSTKFISSSSATGSIVNSPSNQILHEKLMRSFNTNDLDNERIRFIKNNLDTILTIVESLCDIKTQEIHDFAITGFINYLKTLDGQKYLYDLNSIRERDNYLNTWKCLKSGYYSYNNRLYFMNSEEQKLTDDDEKKIAVIIEKYYNRQDVTKIHDDVYDTIKLKIKEKLSKELDLLHQLRLTGEYNTFSQHIIEIAGSSNKNHIKWDDNTKCLYIPRKTNIEGPDEKSVVELKNYIASQYNPKDNKPFSQAIQVDILRFCCDVFRNNRRNENTLENLRHQYFEHELTKKWYQELFDVVIRPCARCKNYHLFDNSDNWSNILNNFIIDYSKEKKFNNTDKKKFRDNFEKLISDVRKCKNTYEIYSELACPKNDVAAKNWYLRMFVNEHDCLYIDIKRLIADTISRYENNDKLSKPAELIKANNGAEPLETRCRYKNKREKINILVAQYETQDRFMSNTEINEFVQNNLNTAKTMVQKIKNKRACCRTWTTWIIISLTFAAGLTGLIWGYRDEDDKKTSTNLIFGLSIIGLIVGSFVALKELYSNVLSDTDENYGPTHAACTCLGVDENECLCSENCDERIHNCCLELLLTYLKCPCLSLEYIVKNCCRELEPTHDDSIDCCGCQV